MHFQTAHQPKPSIKLFVTTQLVTKRFKNIAISIYEQQGYTSLCSEEKNKYLKERLLNTKKERKKKPVTSFKKYWFCRCCFHIFSLKPIKKYKTLLVFKLKCPQCHSGEVMHNDELTEAIINKKSLNEFAKSGNKNILEIEVKYESYISCPTMLNPALKQNHLPDLTIILS